MEKIKTKLSNSSASKENVVPDTKGKTMTPNKAVNFAGVWVGLMVCIMLTRAPATSVSCKLNPNRTQNGQGRASQNGRRN